MEHYFLFDFDEATYLVKYKSDKDLGNQISDTIDSYDADDAEYKDIVDDVMAQVCAEYEVVPCRKYTF